MATSTLNDALPGDASGRRDDANAFRGNVSSLGSHGSGRLRGRGGGAASAGAVETLKIGGTGSAIGAMRIIGAAYEKANPGVQVVVSKNLGSSGGITALLKGKLDMMNA